MTLYAKVVRDCGPTALDADEARAVVAMLTSERPDMASLSDWPLSEEAARALLEKLGIEPASPRDDE